MVWGRKHTYAALARHVITSALVAVCLAFPALSILAAAPSVHAAGGGSDSFGLVSRQGFLLAAGYNATLGAQAGNRTIWRQPSPYGVDQFSGHAPYRTDGWGTIEQGQKFGVSDQAGRPTPPPREEKQIMAAPVPAPDSEPVPEPTPASAKGEASAQQPVPLAASPVQKSPGPAPVKPGSGKAQKKFIRLFSTVDFRSPVKDLPKWERVMQKERRNPSFTENGLACGEERTRERWLDLRNRLQGAPLMEKIKGVNNFFNKWPYRTDTVVWGVEDYWAAPCEFLARSGDCEDYAIIKYYALKSLGVPANIMRIAAVKDTIRGIGHAVLVVYTGDDAYVLDNVSNLVLSHKRLKHYRPLFTVNENYLWRHVKPIAGPDSK